MNEEKGKFGSHSQALLIAFLILTAIVWTRIISHNAKDHIPLLSMLDVGQGDATLLYLEGGPSILIDVGKDHKIISGLEQLMGDRRYVDMVFITHPQADHAGGLDALLDKYDVGAVVINGRTADGAFKEEWQDLINKIIDKDTALITLKAGDSVSYRNSRLLILSPDKTVIQSSELNDTSLVIKAETPTANILFTGDIGHNIESYLIENKVDVSANILKVAHHGSKFSSSEQFLNYVAPSVALIGTGKNSYGHPSTDAIERLNFKNISIFRTDTDGLIKIMEQNDTLRIITEKHDLK